VPRTPFPEDTETVTLEISSTILEDREGVYGVPYSDLSEHMYADFWVR
jgi:hypothetical protein